MNKYFKRSILSTAILGMLGGHAKALTTNNLSLGVIPITEENTFEKTVFYRENPLGVIGNFHLVGFSSV